MRMPEIGDEIQYGVNRFKIAKINKKSELIEYDNGLGQDWSDLERCIYNGEVAVFRGDEIINLKEQE